MCTLAIVVIAVAGCDLATVPTASAPATSDGSAPASTAASPLPSPVRTEPPSDPPTPAPSTSPSDGAAAHPDPATFLQVCRSADLADVAPVPCSDVVEAALGAPELAGTRIERVETGGTCDPARSCGLATVAPAAWVTVLSDGDPMIVKVVLGADGGLSVAAVYPAIPPERPPFTPPAPGLADLPGAPPSLAGRTAYPLCGTEQAPMGGPYDETARTCFLTGVLAGSPVELAALSTGTEGGALVSLYRYAGSGGVGLVTGEDGRWTRRFTGIADATGGLVFDIAGMSTAPEPVP